MSEAAVAEAAPNTEAPPAAAPAPPGPFSADDLRRRDLPAGLSLEAKQHGLVLTLNLPFLDGAWSQQQQDEARTTLERPLHEARAAALAAPDVVEWQRRTAALASASGQRLYFEQRAGDLRRAVKAALAAGDDAALAGAEANLQQAAAELVRFEGRQAALGPLAEQAKRLAEGTLKAAVFAASRAAVAAANQEVEICQKQLVAAVLAVLSPWLAARLRLEQVAQSGARDQLSELPPPEAKKGS
jgi:hypothetical protein